MNSLQFSSELKFCDVLEGNITITGATSRNATKLEYLSAIRTLNGCLTIQDTNLKDLSFMRALKEVHCEADQPPILIENNDLLTDIGLGLYNIRSSYGRPVVIRNNKYLCLKIIETLGLFLNTVPNSSLQVPAIEIHDGDQCNNDMERNTIKEACMSNVKIKKSIQM
ncbi:receptor L domain protein [Dictyocaulus viviparus]|uniref:Receptor L domain protein n=1 Tax=Dictyocaulus viviparus TaxID=29172 RepID=A0A0D8XH71_DICVI|nr:receptor L domain protein [Dictyocaulus viviparus]